MYFDLLKVILVNIDHKPEIHERLLHLSEAGLKKFKQQQLPLRFADAWGVFKSFAKYNAASLSLATA